MMSRLQILPVLFLLALLALSPLPSMAQEPDYDVPGGHFYTQASGQGGGAGTGYRITDEADIPFWTQFQGLGGVAAVGYVSSRRFEHNGLTNQATQKYVLQWQPGGLYYLNVFDELSAMGKDDWLASVRAIPKPGTFDEAGKPFSQVTDERLALLDANPAIKQLYMASPDPVRTHGLPTTRVEDVGPAFVVRNQRDAIQQWKVDMPWARAGEVTIVNGGDIAKEAGLVPPEAAMPEAAVGGATPSSDSSPGSSSETEVLALRAKKFILAGYFPWFSLSTWNQFITSDKPLIPYNSDEPATIARHISEAREAGIDGFVSAWLSPGERTDRNFAKILVSSAGTSFYSAVSIQTSFYKAESQGKLEDSLRYVVSSYGNHPNYLKFDGKPVIFFVDMPRVPGGAEDPKAAWQQIRSRVDPRNEQVWIAEGLDPSYLQIFDGLYVFKISHRDWPDDYLKLPRWGDQVRQWEARLGTPKLWMATIMPGWDDSRTAGKPEQLRDPSPAHGRDREDGHFYRKTFEKACESRPDWLFVTTFNEWVEGTQIEPSVTYGDRYLELTREFAEFFKSSC